jgi:hypothetical protein
MKIGIICGSHRNESQSEKIGRYAAAQLEQQGLCDEVFVFSLAGNPLPFWDEGIWAGAPEWEEAIGELRGELDSCDGFRAHDPRTTTYSLRSLVETSCPGSANHDAFAPVADGANAPSANTPRLASRRCGIRSPYTAP